MISTEGLVPVGISNLAVSHSTTIASAVGFVCGGTAGRARPANDADESVMRDDDLARSAGRLDDAADQAPRSGFGEISTALGPLQPPHSCPPTEICLPKQLPAQSLSLLLNLC